MRRLKTEFFLRENVVEIARDLLGCTLVSEFDGQRTSGKIVETEAYRAPDDRACHAFGNRRTARTEPMFGPGGRAYIYLCYGIHHLFNVVTGPSGMAHAVLIRAIEPLEGIDLMARRRDFEPDFLQKKGAKKFTLTSGPGAVGKALNLKTGFSGIEFSDPKSPVWLEEKLFQLPENHIVASPRVGVDYAGECVAWPWRFSVKGNEWVSRPRP